MDWLGKLSWRHTIEYYSSLRKNMKVFHDKFSSVKNTSYKFIQWPHWVKHGMHMRGSHVVAQFRSSFKRTSCGESKWLTVSSCCTIRSTMMLCWGHTSLVCSQSMTEHEGTPRIRSFLPDMGFLLRATFTWEFLSRLAETQMILLSEVFVVPNFVPPHPCQPPLYRCQIFIIVWKLSKTTSAPSPLPSTGVSSNKPLAHLVLF